MSGLTLDQIEDLYCKTREFSSLKKARERLLKIDYVDLKNIPTCEYGSTSIKIPEDVRLAVLAPLVALVDQAIAEQAAHLADMGVDSAQLVAA